MFNRGDKLTKENYASGAVWCNANGLVINPNTWVIEEAPPISEKEKAQIEIVELKQKLEDTDYQALKWAEKELTDYEYEPMRLQRKAWREQIRELEKLL